MMRGLVFYYWQKNESVEAVAANLFFLVLAGFVYLLISILKSKKDGDE